MSFREKPAPRPIPQGQSTLASYLHGVVPISVPQNPSLPPAPRTPFAPYRRLFTGLPVDPVLETEANPPTSESRRKLTVDSQGPNHTPSSTLKATSKRTSAPKSTSTSTPLSTHSNGPYLHDPAETFAAARLESLIPSPFLISASETRQNVILPPSAPRPTPTRYTILFDAAHTLVMHQSVANGTANPSYMRRQLDELTRISHQQAKLILDLEAENANLKALVIQWGLGVPGTSLSPKVTKREKKRGGKRRLHM